MRPCYLRANLKSMERVCTKGRCKQPALFTLTYDYDDKLAVMADEVAAWEPAFLDVDPVHGAWFDISTGELWIMDPATGDFSRPGM